MRGIGIALAMCAIFITFPVMAADTPPHLDTSGVNLQPAYPASALKNSERGAPVIGVNVTETGKVNYVYPLKTSGFDDLDSAAVMGVLGWRFIPAASNGKNIAGDTAVEIVFQPPDTPNSAAQPAEDPPKPKEDYLPQSIQMQADRASYHGQNYAVLCPNGTLRSTIEFEHPLGAPAWGWSAAVSLMVRAGKDDVVTLQMLGREFISPPQEVFALKRRQDDDKSAVSYSHSTTLGQRETVSLSWDSTGLVTGVVGGMETHEAHLKGPASQFELGISSGAAKFTDTALICRPGGPT